MGGKLGTEARRGDCDVAGTSKGGIDRGWPRMYAFRSVSTPINVLKGVLQVFVVDLVHRVPWCVPFQILHGSYSDTAQARTCLLFLELATMSRELM